MRELRVVRGLAGLEAHVLEQQDLAVLEPLRKLLHALSHDRRRERHRGVRELAQTRRHGCQRELLDALALRASEVRDEHQARAARAQLLDRRQGGANARVVGDLRRPSLRVLERDVEVHAHEHPPARDVEVVDASHRIFWIRSTRRFEYPHSLSYQATTFTIVPSMTAVSLPSTIEENGERTMSVETISSSVY